MSKKTVKEPSVSYSSLSEKVKEPRINALIRLMANTHEEADRRLLEIAKKIKDITSVK